MKEPRNYRQQVDVTCMPQINSYVSKSDAVIGRISVYGVFRFLLGDTCLVSSYVGITQPNLMKTLYTLLLLQ